MDSMQKLQSMIDSSENIVFFGGAGVSTESGIPDFRSVDGLYNRTGYKYSPEEIISHSFFVKDPETFYTFYRKNFLLSDDIKPNPAHYKLAELEQCGKLKAVITQNVDGLHQKAGSRNVLELHGSVLRNYCVKCRKFYPDISGMENIPKCECGGIIRPDIVLYEEQLDNATINKAVSAIANADMLIVGGTSLSVYPAASFIEYFKGRYLVVINKTPTQMDNSADLIIREPIGGTLSEIKV